MRFPVDGKILVLFLAFFLAACATDPVPRDLARYLNQGVMNLAELEQKSLEAYGAVTGDNYTSDEGVCNALKGKVIPLYRRFLEGLRALRPETHEVREVNRVLVEAAQSMYDGFRLKMAGIEQNDETIIVAGNDKIDQAAVQTGKWRNDLAALAESRGLALLEGQQKRPWWDIFFQPLGGH